MRSNIRSPIIVIGLGRSGSTLFHRMLAAEKSLQWFCQILEKRPDWPGANRFFMSLRNAPVAGSFLGTRLEPVEAYGFWDKVFPGFRSPFRDLTAEDVNERISGNVHEAFSRSIYPDRARLLLKVTGWPRIGCLQTLFPDAVFIHVSRDPRAVVNSLLQVNWWRGWQGPSNWRWGPLTEADNDVWHRHDKSFVALAAIQCRIYQRAYLRSLSNLPKDAVFEVRYDRLCSHTNELLAGAFEHADLNWSPEFARRLGAFSVRNTDHKYSNQLSAQQIDTLEAVLEEVAYEA